MKILQVVDIPDWAIGKLAKINRDQNEHLDIRIIAIHPRGLRNEPEKFMGIFEQAVQEFDPDVVHFHYWDTANTLSKSKFCNGRKLMLVVCRQVMKLQFPSKWKMHWIQTCWVIRYQSRL